MKPESLFSNVQNYPVVQSLYGLFLDYQDAENRNNEQNECVRQHFGDHGGIHWEAGVQGQCSFQG